MVDAASSLSSEAGITVLHVSKFLATCDFLQLSRADRSMRTICEHVLGVMPQLEDAEVESSCISTTRLDRMHFHHSCKSLAQVEAVLTQLCQGDISFHDIMYVPLTPTTLLML